MTRYERRQRWIRLTGTSLTAATLYLLFFFTALSGSDQTRGIEGAYASAGATGTVALDSVDQALRGGPSPLILAEAPVPHFGLATFVAAADAPVLSTSPARTLLDDGLSLRR